MKILNTLISSTNGKLTIATLLLTLIAFFTQDPFGLMKTSYKSSEYLLGEWDNESVDSIKLSGVSSLNFSLKENTVQEMDAKYPLDKNKVFKLLNLLKKLRRYRKVTSDETRYNDLETNQSGLGLTLLFNDGNKKTIWLGKTGESYNTNLVRLDTESVVYSVRRNIRQEWAGNIDEYRKKDIIDLSKPNVSSINIKGKKVQVNLDRSSGTWLVEGKPASKEKVNTLLESIENLKGNEFTQKSAPLYGTIIIGYNSGIKKEIEFRGLTSDNKIFIKSSDNPYWLSVYESTIESLFSPKDTFKEKKSNKTENQNTPGLNP